jgi:alkanesulfonate monooxygenase SsuD/methylene tetrahydromethanopterin reductase-like flavin-dependent oxidoreductase (luciferase family)
VVSADGPSLGSVALTVRIGFRTSPQNTDWASLEAAWIEAGQHDVFDSGWLNDHLTDPGAEHGGSSFESVAALAALAHHVPGKWVGQTVLAATFRHPSVLAKSALTLDHVTGGRFVLCLGAGWHVGEHEAFGIELPPLRERFDRYESAVRVIKALFSQEASAAPGVTLDAAPWRLSGATMEPAPVRPGGPPLWLGGQGPRGLRIAARHADGWNFASNLDGSPSGFADRRDALLRACEAVGRDPAELTLSAQIIIPGESRARRAATDRAIAYGREGAQELLLTTPAREGADGIRRLAIEVAARIRDAFG